MLKQLKKSNLQIFHNTLCRDIGNLLHHSDEFKFFTVDNYIPVFHMGKLETYIERTVKVAELSVENIGELKGLSSLDDICLIMTDLSDDAEGYIPSEQVDVRDVLSGDRMKLSVEKILNLFLLTELYPNSSVMTDLRDLSIRLYWALRQSVLVAMRDIVHVDEDKLECNHEIASRFFEEYGFSYESTPIEPMFDMKYVRHDKQVIFTENELAAIKEANDAREKAEQQKKQLEQVQSYSKGIGEKLYKLFENDHATTFGMNNDVMRMFKDQCSVEECEKVINVFNFLKRLSDCNSESGATDDVDASLERAKSILKNDVLNCGDFITMSTITSTPPCVVAQALSILGGSVCAKYVDSLEYVGINDKIPSTTSRVVLTLVAN